MNDLLTLQTNTFRVNVQHSEKYKDRYYSKIENNVLNVHVPTTIDYTKSEDFAKRVLPNVIEHFLKLEAERKLHNRLKELSLQLNLTYSSSKIFVPRRVKKPVRSHSITFGAYYPLSKEIKLNAFLMLLPDEQIDTILIHELCHIVHQNHRKAFYQLFETHSPMHRELKLQNQPYVDFIFKHFR